MARYRYRYTGSRYRGSRGPSLWVILAVLAAAGALAFLAFRFFAPEAEPEPSVPAAVVVQPEPEAELPPEPEVKMAALPQDGVRGIYISGPMAGSEYMAGLISLVEETELNAVVIDVKNDEGSVTYRPGSGTAEELGACVKYISDLPGLVASLKEKGIYTIARITAFKDPVLAKAKPELALRRTDGSPLTAEGGQSWVNPYERKVWDYLTELALGAAQAGFNEVQFDYVRFPTVSDISSVDFGPEGENLTREEAIVGFLEHARGALHEKGVWMSADVFGTVIDSALDAGLIGQNYAAMGAAADFICPMVYPSHYAAGAYGLEVPDSKPYETVKAAMDRSQLALSGIDEEERAGVRAWLQGFTATWVRGYIPYGGEQLRAQIQAVYDAGYTDWIIWNASNKYSAEGLLPAEG